MEDKLRQKWSPREISQRFGERSRGIAERLAIERFLPVSEQKQGQGLAEKEKES
jgi:hypothetical protein